MNLTGITSEQIDNLAMSIRVSNKNVLDIEETAWYLGVSADWVRKICRTEEIKSHKTGKKIFIKKSDIEDYMLQSEETDYEAERYTIKTK